nr:MAG TPA: hypothetical protein [Caudoviricetes sp.]
MFTNSQLFSIFLHLLNCIKNIIKIKRIDIKDYFWIFHIHLNPLITNEFPL